MSPEDCLAILFVALHYDYDQRRAWLRRNFGANYTDEMTVPQQMQAIEMLRAEFR